MEFCDTEFEKTESVLHNLLTEDYSIVSDGADYHLSCSLWEGLIQLMLVFLAIVFLLLFLGGISQLLHALWELREGSNRNAFVSKGMLGIGLIAIAFLVPYLVMFMTSVQHVQQTNLP